MDEEQIVRMARGCARCCWVPGKEAAAMWGQWLILSAEPRLPGGEGGSKKGATMKKSRRRRRITTRRMVAAEAGRLVEIGAATATAMAPPPSAREDTGRSPTRL